MTDQNYSFILFVSGMSVKSSHAVENLKAICDQHLKNKFKLQIIDITKEKEKAAEHQIFAIPTLIKIRPLPSRTIIGDLSQTEKVLKILEINE